VSKIKVFFEDIEPLSIQNNNISQYIKGLIKNEFKQCGDISVVFWFWEINLPTEFLNPNSVLKPIDSPFGHCAANPGNDKNFELQLDKNISELLNE